MRHALGSVSKELCGMASGEMGGLWLLQLSRSFHPDILWFPFQILLVFHRLVQAHLLQEALLHQPLLALFFQHSDSTCSLVASRAKDGCISCTLGPGEQGPSLALLWCSLEHRLKYRALLHQSQ